MLINEKIRLRNQFFRRIHAFFQEKDVAEVDTNLISNDSVTDVNLSAIALKRSGYLITSPEYAMKSLLSQGSGDIYQLSHVFRDDEFGNKHLKEFTLLEWYRLGFDHYDLMNEVAELIKILLEDSNLKSCVNSYAALFWDYLEIDIFNDSDAILNLVKRKIPEALDWNLDRDGYLDLLFTHYIEPNLGDNKIEFIIDYLPSQAALARIINKEGHQVAARFEAYINGIELCNGFWELTDAAEQRERFEFDNQKRKKLGLEAVEIDQSLLEALEKGIPDCAGVALGVDRLLMIKAGAQTIQEIAY